MSIRMPTKIMRAQNAAFQMYLLGVNRTRRDNELQDARGHLFVGRKEVAAACVKRARDAHRRALACLRNIPAWWVTA